MAWRPMMLRGTRVLARCTDTGDLVAPGGRVEVRYKPTDAKAYSAGARNLEPIAGSNVLPDSTCVPASADAAKKGAKKSSSAGARSGMSAPEAPTGNEVLVYADGACSGNPGPCGIGVVLVADSEQRELSEYLGHGTNNVAELTAIMRAAKAMPDRERPLRLYTDSSYAIGVLQKGWKAKANVELVAEVKRALAELTDVELYYVRGHAGVRLNERADQLARAAVESRASSGWRAARKASA